MISDPTSAVNLFRHHTHVRLKNARHWVVASCNAGCDCFELLPLTLHTEHENKISNHIHPYHHIVLSVHVSRLKNPFPRSLSPRASKVTYFGLVIPQFTMYGLRIPAGGLTMESSKLSSYSNLESSTPLNSDKYNIIWDVYIYIYYVYDEYDELGYNTIWYLR